MNNSNKEKQIDDALLAQFELDPHLKITTSLTMAIHRQLMTLSNKTGVAINDMNREFIVENLTNVTVTDSVRKALKASMS